MNPKNIFPLWSTPDNIIEVEINPETLSIMKVYPNNLPGGALAREIVEIEKEQAVEMAKFVLGYYKEPKVKKYHCKGIIGLNLSLNGKSVPHTVYAIDKEAARKWFVDALNRVGVVVFDKESLEIKRVKDPKPEGEKLRAYYCTNFKGHWPVPTCGIVVAKDKTQAREILANDLVRNGLKVPEEGLEMVKMSLKTAGMELLLDGEY